MEVFDESTEKLLNESILVKSSKFFFNIRIRKYIYKNKHSERHHYYFDRNVDITIICEASPSFAHDRLYILIANDLLFVNFYSHHKEMMGVLYWVYLSLYNMCKYSSKTPTFWVLVRL